MNVLLITTHLEIGGVSAYTVNLANALAKKGHRVVVASSGGVLACGVKKENPAYLEINLKTKQEFTPKVLLSVPKIIGAIRRFKIDVIHAQTRVTQVASCIASRLTGVPYVATCHGFFKPGRLGRRLFPCWGDATIGISEAVCRQLVEDFKLPEDKVKLIYNGIDSAKFSRPIPEEEKRVLKTNLGIDENKIAIGAISRLSPVKGLKYLILAMKDILKEEPGARLLLIGDGPARQGLIDLSRNLGIEKNIKFISSVTDTRPYLSIMDIFVFPSIQEGLGLSLLEALVSARACVAADVGGVSTIIKNELTGLLIPPEDSHALKDAIIRLISDRELASRLGHNGMELVREKFSLEEMADKTIHLYESVRK